MFFYHPRMTGYEFGPKHPLRPERLRRTIALLERVAPKVEALDPGLADLADLLRVHDEGYVRVVESLSCGERVPHSLLQESGFLGGDNPPFPGMYEAALAYCGGAVRAARLVRDGAPLAFNIAGGLHHARRSQASGFCVFNDCAIALTVLRERYERVAYVDIDLHHGDGVQWLFYDDPTVLTCSVHETGRTLYPGTGFVEETGAEATSLNVPLEPHTTGDTWLWAFERTVLPALERYQPGAVVLQMGTDAHTLDPLGHLDLVAQEWLEAVRLVRDTGLPIVALGGGGYDMTTVPRMWVAAVLTLLRTPFDDDIPYDLPPEWGLTTFSDRDLPSPRNRHRAEAEVTVAEVERLVLDRLPRP